MRGTTENHSLSLQEKEAFVRHALPAMAEHTFGFISSVIGVSDTTMGRHFGSALRCKLNGRRAIVTALHVIEAARREPLGLAFSTGYGQRPYIVEGPVDVDPRADMAVYFLPDDYPGGDEVFWPAARIDRPLDRLSTDYLFLHGFPGSRSYPSRLLGGVVIKSLPYGAMQRVDNVPADLEVSQFAVDYDPAGMVSEAGAAQDVVDPRGLSGGPVWRIGVSGRPSREWKPTDSLLVGILTQWRPKDKVLIATAANKLPSS